MTSTDARISACCDAAELGALALVGADPLGLEPGVVVVPGIASILPPSAGIHQEWMTSKSGALTSSWTVWPTGARRRSIAMTPFGYVKCQ